MLPRHDYAYPFRIDPASRQAAQARYDVHVEQMIKQILLTAPGERVNLPEFGCGLRQILFAPHSEALTATTKIQVQQALNRWLAGQIQLQEVQIFPPGATDEKGQVLDDAVFYIQIKYILIEYRTPKMIRILVA